MAEWGRRHIHPEPAGRAGRPGVSWETASGGSSSDTVIRAPCLSVAELPRVVRAMAVPSAVPAPAPLVGSGSFFVADLTAAVALRADTLYTIPERGDRLIAATAAHLGLPLVTRDPDIARAAGVALLW